MTCIVEGCAKAARVRHLCEAHYARLRRYGDPTYQPPRGMAPTPLIERIADKFTVGDGCWLWHGCADALGYGQVAADGRNNRKVQAHRAVYELMVGPIPDGLHLDHLCCVPACVRPSHLEPVTQAENNRRSGARRRDEFCHSEFGGWSLEVQS